MKALDQKEYYMLQSVVPVLTKINSVNSDAIGQIEKMFDAAREKDGKRGLRDLFQAKAFLQGTQDVLNTPRYVFESLTTRHPKHSRLGSKMDTDVLMWNVIGQYCTQHPEILEKADFTDMQLKRLRAVMPAGAGITVPSEGPKFLRSPA